MEDLVGHKVVDVPREVKVFPRLEHHKPEHLGSTDAVDFIFGTHRGY